MPNLDTGCQEYRELSRRGFLRSSRAMVAQVAAASVPAWLPRISLAADASSRDTLIVVFLRGGMDSLSVVVPYGDPNYYASTLRPTIAIPPPGETNGAIDLDGFFGFAPAMGPLKEVYDAQQLAVLHAVASPDTTRSHFEAYDVIEYATPLAHDTLFTGWLARHLQTSPPIGTGLLRALAVNTVLPRTMSGAPATLPIPDPATFDFPGDAATITEARAVLEQLYATTLEPMSSAAQSTVDTIDLLNSIDFDHYTPSGGAVYAGNAFAQGLKSVAAIIKAEIGLEAAVVERGGWDTHSQQGAIDGGMANNMNLLASGLRAFWLDLQNYMDRVSLVVQTEFGRRADENSSLGSDHGYATAMFAMGGNINGGQVITDWTDGELLHPDLLYNGDSLDMRVDYRDVLAEILDKRLDSQAMTTIFPNFTPTYRGVANG